MTPADLTAAIPIDFLQGPVPAGTTVEAGELGRRLGQARLDLLDLPVERVVSALDGFSARLLARDNPLHRRYPGAGLAYVASWCRRRSLEPLLEESLGDPRALDEYLVRGARASRGLRAWPRGLVLHWMAGNVPTLGFLSLLMGLLTKNANLVKVASSQDDLLARLLEGLAETPGGAELTAAVAVARFSHSQLPQARAVSSLADVRVIWGSDESVATVRALPSRLEALDLVFPNRVSFIVVGAGMLRQGDLKALAQRMAQDISVFEQKACASPHTVFLETESQETLESFARLLAEALQAALRGLPKTPPSQREVAALLNLRAEYDMFHQAWYSRGTEFTVLSDDKFQLGPAIGNRTIFLRRVADLAQVAQLITPKVQSVGVAAEGAELDRLADLLAARGVHRFARVGGMTSFDMPWDGFLLPQNLVRWTSRPVAASGQ